MSHYGLKLSEQVQELHSGYLSPLPGLGTSQPKLPLCLYLSNLWLTAQPSGSAPAVSRDFLLVPLVSWGLTHFSPPVIRLFDALNALAERRGWHISHDRESSLPTQTPQSTSTLEDCASAPLQKYRFR